MKAGGEWARYPRCPAATAIGTAAVHLLGGNRAEASARRSSARAEQDERWRRTGYVGSDVEAATAVRLELRRRRYSQGAQNYGAQLVSHGNAWNWQGQWRLSELCGMSRRSCQRYRKRMQDDGLIDSYLVRAGDMIDGQRAPVTRTHVVRYVRPLIDAAQPRRRREPLRRRGEPRQKTKRERRRPPAVLAPLPRKRDSAPVEPAEIIRFTASIAPTAPAASEQPWVSIAPEPAELDDQELDELDRELASLDSLESYRARWRPPD